MTRRLTDLIGQKYGRWTVQHYIGPAPGTQMWLCKCDCGQERAVSAGNMKSGASKSCGCWQQERASEVHFRHGQTDHPLYNSWAGLKNRCLNKNDQDYKYYGGRGIKVCDRWLLDFWHFWDDMASGWRPGLTIERKDVDGNYEKNNCCWLTIQDQQKNKRKPKHR